MKLFLLFGAQFYFLKVIFTDDQLCVASFIIKSRKNIKFQYSMINKSMYNNKKKLY